MRVAVPELVGDIDRDSTKLSSLAPGLVLLPGKARTLQVACGLHHSGLSRFVVSTYLAEI